MPSKEYYHWVVTSTKIYDIVTYFAYEIKSCQNQNLCFKSFDYHSDRGYRKYLQSLLASNMSNWGNQVQILWCWVTFKYSFLSMKQMRIILHTLLSRLAFYLVKSIVRFIHTSPSHLVSSLVCRTSTQSSQIRLYV